LKENISAPVILFQLSFAVLTLFKTYTCNLQDYTLFNNYQQA